MKLLLEGWRGISQSIALVNQFQALALLSRNDVQLFHRDLPYPNGWDSTRQASGFSPQDVARIAAIPAYADEPVDAEYRISGTCHSKEPGDARRVVTFMVTELGLVPSNFVPGTDLGFFTRGENVIVAPAAWTRDRIVEAGFAAERVRVVPHGVDRTIFYPLPPIERATVRQRLGFAPDETILLNIAGPFWNKGVDLLLEAFAALRARGRRVRLLMKDQSSLYGLDMKKTIQQVGARCPALLTAETLGAISLIPAMLDHAQLRELFAVADAYVSPYRAEGFNLPVLEAIACDVPVVVTAGGVTDDFCPEPLATRVPADAGALEAEPGFPPRRFLQTRVDDLVEAMDRVCQAGAVRPEGWRTAREAVLNDFSWDRAAAMLLDCAGLRDVEPTAAIP